jgi:uncharacterized protein YndB with AHSA1/START domain
MSRSVHEVWVAADRDTVFEALTTVDGLNGWWGEALEASTDPGGAVVFDHGLSEPLRLRIEEIDAPNRVVWRFLSDFTDPTNPASEWLDQTFVWEISERAPVDLLGMVQDVSIVRMVNDGWPEPNRWQGFCTTAWGVTLEDKLKPFCETGSTATGVVGG